jgi:hypothetical protein
MIMHRTSAESIILARMQTMLEGEKDPQRCDLIQWYLDNADKETRSWKQEVAIHKEQDAIYRQIMG